MNGISSLTRTCLIAVFTFVAALASTASMGAVLLEIDVTNPAAVVFTATSNNSAIANSDYDNEVGSCLLNFFTADAPDTDDAFSSSTLKPTSTSDPYDYFWVDVDDEGGLRSACAYFYTGTENQDFSTSSRAFEGSATIDLTGYPLPAAGSSGNIVSGYSAGDVSAPLGEWSVNGTSTSAPITAVPTMSAYGLALTMLGLLVVAGRRLRIATKKG